MRPRCLAFLTLVAALCIVPPARGAVPQSRSQPTPAAGVLATVSGEVGVERPGSGRPLAGTIGMRLQPGDAVRVGRGSSATIYLAGGGIVRVPAGSRIEIPQRPGGTSGGATGPGSGPAGASAPGAMSSRSVEVLEEGLWILNDPEGSVLLSAMRGDDEAWDDAGGSGPLPLSPRFETILDPRPLFVWSGSGGPVRVALARGKEVLWRSAPAASSYLILPEEALKLRAGEVYRWWLESGDGGSPLGESVPFRLADKATQTDASRFEGEIDALARGDDGPVLASLLRCGYYIRVGAWSRVLAAASDLKQRDASSPAASRALYGCRQQMRLGDDGLDALIRSRAGQPASR